MKIVLFILLLLAPTLAQESKSWRGKPIKLTVSVEDTNLGRVLRLELQSRRGDFAVHAAAGQIGADSGCRGLVGALLLEDGRDRQLSTFTSGTAEDMAKQMGERVDAYIQARGAR
jgi:hypothetical protein